MKVYWALRLTELQHQLGIWAIRCVKKQKAPRKAMLFKVAPRPGLEPGTYGLTEIKARQKPL
jgi:hypothetical protein